MVDPRDSKLSISGQCKVLALHRSGIYYTAHKKSEQDQALMNEIDKQYLVTPFYGMRKMCKHLQNLGYNINRKRVRRLYKQMGIVAIYPKPNTSKPDKGHKIYPYLLRGMKITRPNQVWCADITYIRMQKGHMYLVAIMDWHSRYVLSWRLSNSLEAGFCVDALKEAIAKHGKPQIFNTDQGSQFTSDAFTSTLSDNEIKISMDGKGRFMDNIFIERLWRSVKYEYVYLNAAENGAELYNGLQNYLSLYNTKRIHQSLEYETPEAVFRRAA